MAVSPELKQKAGRILSRYDAETRDAMYRHVWKLRAMDDVRAHAKNMGLELSEDQAEFAAELYVYDGEYDCNESYWFNIENVIRLAIERTYP